MSNHLRHLDRRDDEAIRSIERLAFDPADRWGPERYARAKAAPSTFVLVAEAAGPAPDGWNPVVGVMAYRILRDRFEVLHLAVHAECWGGGIGRRLLDRVQGKLGPSRDRVTLDVPDDFLGTQLFLRACGFRATGVDRDGAGYGRDLYRFEHRLEAGVLASPPLGVEDRSC